MSSQELVIESKEKLLQTVADLKRASDAAGGQLADLQRGVEALTGSYRELRNLHTAAQSYTPSGTDAELGSRYMVPAESVAAQAAQVGTHDRLEYEDVDARRSGKQYAANKDREQAVRMLSEWDESGHCTPGLIDDPEPVTPWQHRLQQLAELRSLVRTFTAKPDTRGGIRLGASPKVDAMIRRHLLRGPEIVRQVVADNAGEGAELIPDVTLPELTRRLEVPRNVVGLFGVQNIPTGGSTINPFLIAGAQPFIVGVPASGDLDPADIQRSVPSLTTVSTAPVTWGVSIPASRDATEDSILEWSGFAQMLLAEAIRDGEEDEWINADTNGGDTGLANWNIRSRWNTLGHTLDHRKSAIGLRAFSFDVSSAGAMSAETAVGMLTDLTAMDSPQFMDQVVGITSPEWVVKHLLTDTNLLTVDKYGQLATLLTGEIGSIGGKPLVMSEFVDIKYNASGVYDDTTKTKTGFLWVNRSRWVTAQRRGPRVEAEIRPSQHIQLLVLTQRRTPRHLGRSTEKSVTWRYNGTP